MTEIAYTMIWHAMGGPRVKKSDIIHCDTRPNIEDIELPEWVDHVEMHSPAPMEFNLNYRPAPSVTLPTEFQTFYFRNASTFPLGILLQTAESDASRNNIYNAVMTGLAHDYYFASGASEDELTEEAVKQTPVIVTADQRIYAFAANCALLQKTYHPAAHDPHPKKIWDRITPALYALGTYKTS